MDVPGESMRIHGRVIDMGYPCISMEDGGIIVHFLIWCVIGKNTPGSTREGFKSKSEFLTFNRSIRDRSKIHLR